MVYNGYLKISKKLSNDEYMIKIPNYEIQTFFKKGFIDKFLVSGNYFNPMMDALLDGDIEEFEKIWFKKEDGDYDNSLRLLSEYLYNYYQKKVVLLIDEYDSPLITANQRGYYKDSINFFRNFLSLALKTNSNLKMGVLTGIVQVAKEGIFSGLNNVITYNILGNDFEIFFGLSEEEVENSLKYFELEYEIEEVKKWYDGYKFGNSEVYNPWSIINYLSDRKLQVYWVNTIGKFLVSEKKRKNLKVRM